MTGVEPVDTTGEVAGVWGPVVTGGRGGDTGTESDPRAPVDCADINHCILRRGGPRRGNYGRFSMTVLEQPTADAAAVLSQIS